jgi:hypothetical protein
MGFSGMEKRIIHDRDSSVKFDSSKRKMPILKCVCGFEILVVPDLKAMNYAIKNHIDEHKKGRYGSENILRFDTLETFLTQRTLIAIHLERSKEKFSVLSHREETRTSQHSLKN